MLRQAHIKHVFNSRSVSGDVDEEPKLLVYGISQVPAGAGAVKEHGLLVLC